MAKEVDANTLLRSDLLVRLTAEAQAPTTDIQRVARGILLRDGPLPCHKLVDRVADALYRRELREGAWMVDFGMFSSAVFVPTVASEIYAANGSLWRIGE